MWTTFICYLVSYKYKFFILTVILIYHAKGSQTELISYIYYGNARPYTDVMFDGSAGLNTIWVYIRR